MKKPTEEEFLEQLKEKYENQKDVKGILKIQICKAELA